MFEIFDKNTFKNKLLEKSMLSSLVLIFKRKRVPHNPNS